jgi:hypothetical protein
MFGEESDTPVLSVELYWEYDPRSENDWSCRSVPVKAAEWRLLNSQGEVVKEFGRDEEICRDTLNFLDLDLGKYSLEVAGYNEAGDKAWEGSCKLELDRFDRVTSCTVYQLES